MRSDKIAIRITESSKKAHAAVKDRIYSAMARIEREIEQSDGAYLSRLSISEVCRRAHVDRATLEKPTHKTSTLAEVRRWLEKVRQRIPKDAKGRRSASAKRVETYKTRLDAVCQRYHEAELEMISLRSEIEKFKSQLASNARVIPLGRRAGAK